MSQRPSLLFPSANALKGVDNSSQDARLTSSTHVSHGADIGGSDIGLEVEVSLDGADARESSQFAAASATLDWLTNKSFRSDDAITIAKQHLRSAQEDEHGGLTEAASLHHQRLEHAGRADDSVESVARALTEGRLSNSPRRHQSRKHKHKRDSDTDTESREKRRRHHHGRHHRDKKRKHSKRKQRRNYDSSSDSSPGEDNRSASIGGSTKYGTDLVSDGFCIDVKSDKNNLCFDSLHFTNTVAYHRLGHSCLGLDKSRQLVSWKDGKPKRKHKAQSNDKMRYYMLGLHGGPAQEETTYSIDQGPVETGHQRMHSLQDSMSYIPVDTPSRHAKPDFDPLGVYDSSTQAYLGSKPQSKPAASEPDNRSFSGHSGLSRTIASYNRHLHENPQDVGKWLEFVRFQDTAEYDRLVSAGSGQSQPEGQAADTKQSSRKRTAKAIAEKKLAILDKAILKNPRSIPLQLERLEIGKLFWDVADQVRQWEKLLKSNPEDVALWREYLLFKQGSFSTFSVSKVAELYGKCFRTLLSKSQELDDLKAAELENHLLDLFVSLCHFWRQAGHTEKAVAAFQAMIELNCFCPPQFQQDTHLQGQVAFLETFWDSSKPRFGEKEAKGWAGWMLKKEKGGWEPVKIPEAEETSEEPSSPVRDSSNQPLWQAWVREEVFREQDHFAPWRPNDAKGETEEDCEDPERMVLFDDITHVLFRLCSPRKQFQLVLLFLDFLGVSVPRCLLQSPGDATDATRLYLEQPSQIFAQGSSSSTFSSACHPSLTPSGVSGNCRSLEHVTDSIDCTKKSNSVEEKRALEEFVEEVFNQITPVFPEPARTQLLLLRLDFQMQRAVTRAGNKQLKKKHLKEAKRFAKKLLSQEENRNNLDLWASLARWEQSLGNTEEAKRVLQTALVFLGQIQTEKHRQSAARIAEAFADLFVSFESENTSNMEVLHVLSSVAEGTYFIPFKDVPGQGVSSTRILKGRRNYQELVMLVLASQGERTKGQDSATTDLPSLCHPSGSHIVHLTKCFATFQYLTVSMQAASVVFESSLSAIRKACATLGEPSDHPQLKLDQELLTVAHVRLLSSHVFSNPSPLGTLRNLIKASLADFPSNSALLEAFIFSETKSHIAGRVRRYFDQVTKHTGSPAHWIFAVRAELLRKDALMAVTNAVRVEDLPAQEKQHQVSETGISHRIRALFDRASESQNSHHCVLLWRMYMQFEIQQGNLKRAESIFYSALQHCPWAKVLYVDAVRYFPSKLQDIQDLLMEKELRVRAPLEEVELLMKT